MIAIGRMQVAEREALYPSRTYDDDNNDNILFTRFRYMEKKIKKKGNYRKTKLIEIL